MELTALLYALGGTAFTLAMTCAGAATVFLFRDRPTALATKLSLGFAAGIMIGAAVWSLLLPAMDMAVSQGQTPALPAVLGFILGAGFLMALDNAMPHLHPLSQQAEGPRTHLHRHSLLFLAITIHNIPEGMAVGIAFVAAVTSPGAEGLTSAIALALGMGIQNIPEGAAVSLPLHSSGSSRTRAFALGVVSGLVEPLAAVLTVMLAFVFLPVMPYLLSFAAGAMFYVVIEELLPAAKLGEHSDMGTVSVLSGFLIMMLLDTSLV